MDALEIVFGLAVLLLTYLGPLLRRLFLKQAGKRMGEGSAPDVLLSDDSSAPDEMELELAPASSPVVQRKRWSARVRPLVQAQEMARGHGVGNSPRRRIDAQLIREIVILEAFLSSPRSLHRH